MKIAFKVLSILLIITSSVEILLGAVMIFGMDWFMEKFNEAGMYSAEFGALGMAFSIVGAIVIAVGGLMLYTGINGVRERMEKCRKFTFWFLILSAVNFVLAIVQNSNTASAFLWLLFFGVYYFLAKNCMKNDSNFY